MIGPVLLRDVEEDDLPAFFQHQCNPTANRMAAFAARDRPAFMAHWRTKILGDDTVIKKTVLFRGQVAGNVVCFEQSGRPLVGYWLGEKFWGQGIATTALSDFLDLVNIRPLHAHVFKENLGSIRVLEKCGFVLSDGGETPAGAGGAPDEKIEELVFRLGK